MIEGVAIFDLSETLIDSDSLWNNAFKKMLDELKIKQDEKILEVLEDFGFDYACIYLMDFYRVPYTHSELLKKLAHYAIGSFHQKITLREGAAEFISKIKASGYATVVLASGNPLMMELTRKHYADELEIDKWLNTRELNIAKNDTKLYTMIASSFDVSTDKCILFDDLEEVIKSAKKAGVKTVYIGEGTSSCAEFSSQSFTSLMGIYTK